MMLGKKYIIFLITIMMMILSSSKISFSTDKLFNEHPNIQIFKAVINELLKNGVDLNFINNIVTNENTKFDEKFVKINVTGYLKKADYSHNFNTNSVNKSTEFLNNNNELLKRAEVQFGVPAEVITSILWIETKHGSFLGNNNIVSVYLSTALCNQPEYLKLNLDEIKSNFKGNSNEFKELEDKLISRSNKKAKWALEQLIALEKMEKSSPIPIIEIKGSWAGAFGLSQFLPSSYMSWAIDGNDDKIINLFELEDAVFSVANYLKQNGWGDSLDAQRKAVFHYNNSNAYVDAVLKLAEKIKPIEEEIQIDVKLPLDEQLKH